MAYSARVLCDSISPSGVRLTTFELTFPRFILAEFNTHRMLSRNAASSRAIPVEKRIEAVLRDPFVPDFWGKNQKGMQAGEELDIIARADCERRWYDALYDAVEHARALSQSGLHKQLANRLLEPFSWVTDIVSATEWANFLWLRCHKDAQPEFQRIARMARDVYYVSQPKALGLNVWHLPLIDQEDVECAFQTWEPSVAREILRLASVGRCARISFLTHDGRRSLNEDVALAERLRVKGHWSPYEHVAKPRRSANCWSGNFRGWEQFRKCFKNESRSVLAVDPVEYEEWEEAA